MIKHVGTSENYKELLMEFEAISHRHEGSEVFWA